MRRFDGGCARVARWVSCAHVASGLHQPLHDPHSSPARPSKGRSETGMHRASLIEALQEHVLCVSLKRHSRAVCVFVCVRCGATDLRQSKCAFGSLPRWDKQALHAKRNLRQARGGAVSASALRVTNLGYE